MFYQVDENGFLGNGCSQQDEIFVFEADANIFGIYVKPKVINGVVTEGATSDEQNAVLAAAKVAAEEAIDDAENAYLEKLFGGKVRGARSYEYMLSVLEAAGILAQNTVPQITGASKNILNKKAAQRQTTEVAEAQIVWNKFMQFKDVIGVFSGIRTRNKDVKNAATTKAAVDAAVAQYHADIQAFLATLQ